MRLGQVAGINLVVNDYFLLLLGVYFLLGVLPQAVLLFLAVAWHEAWHVLAARRVGFIPGKVELFPFGGVARFAAPLAFYPHQEARIALVGPIGSLTLALITELVGRLMGREGEPWLAFFIQANLLLGFFNLFPGLPLDGGRLYRSWRTCRVGAGRATLEGAVLGQALALLLAVGGIVGFCLRVTDLQSVILALFIFREASREKEVAPYLFWRQFWRGYPPEERKILGEAWLLAAREGEPVIRIVKRFKPRKYNLVAVIGSGGRVLGLVGEGEVLKALYDGGSGEPIGKLLR
ncbi:peptidase M50 [Thermanaeromonas sp. C210]|uniref:peptidase M50 n=1 Tax=Thermanaeromonas sp. C210 TaxID=2731925 RepID=UPI00155C8D47|nr:peptidase M50 [Thermanaeromonas sp. C210]GFN22590.1 peptidase M50 [Thermanaeromonas sp. C210]